jgi:hypothetical protein
MNGRKYGLAATAAGILTSSLLAAAPTDALAANTTNTNANAKPAMIAPSAQPIVTNWADFFFTVDYIYWKAVQEGTDFAIKGYTPKRGKSVDSGGHVHYPDFDYKPGFKVGAGMVFSHDNWDLYANYTWYRVYDQHGSANATEGTAMLSTYSYATAITSNGPSTGLRFNNTNVNTPGVQYVTHVGTNWRLNFNSLDLELGRNFWNSRYLTMRPFIGLKFGWIRQSEHMEYKALSFDETWKEVEHVRQTQDFFGVGIRTGLDTAWHINQNWSIYGDFAIAALWSNFENNRRDHNAVRGSEDFNPNVATSPLLFGKSGSQKIKGTIDTLTPVLELGLGFMYQYPFHNDRYELRLKAGWEEQVWFNHDHYIDPIARRDGNNLVLQGFTGELGLAF